MTAPNNQEGGTLQSIGESVEGFAGGLTKTLSLGGRAIAVGVPIAEYLKGEIGSFDEFAGRYNEVLENTRETFARTEEAAPGSAFAGEVAGVAATSLAAPAAAGARGAAALGAAQGAFQAAGEAEDLGTTAGVGEAAIGAGIGAVTGGVGAKIGEAAVKVAKAAKTSARQVLQDLNFPRKAFKMGSGSTRTPEQAVDNLIKRGLIPSDSLEARALKPSQLENVLDVERRTVGATIEAAVEAADDILPDIDSNKLGLRKLVKDVKGLKGLVELGEDKIGLDSLEQTLSGARGPLKLMDLWNMRKLLDANIGRLAKKGSKDVLEGKRLSALMDGRSRIRSEMVKQIDGAAKNNRTLKDILQGKSFGEIGNDYGDVATLRDFVTDLAAAERKSETTFLKAFAESATGASSTIGAGVGAAATAASGGSVGAGFLTGAAVASGIRAASRTGALEAAAIAGEKATRQILSRSGRVIAEVAQRDSAIASHIYQSYDKEASTLSNPDDVRTHIGHILKNPSIPHAQKFREMNMVQKTGRINPESIAPDVKERVERDLDLIERQTTQEALQLLRGL